MANIIATVIRHMDAGKFQTLCTLSLPAEMIPRKGEFINFENGETDRLEHHSVVVCVRWDYRPYQADCYNLRPNEDSNPRLIKVEIEVL